MKFPGKHIKEETPMINKLIANIKKTGAPIVVGLDPMLNYITKRTASDSQRKKIGRAHV